MSTIKDLPRCEKYMSLALDEAEKAAKQGDVPVGAVLVCQDQVLAAAHNQRENGGGATAHAEILVIEAACRKLARWRLSDCELFVTLEPCPMCAGAVLNARIGRVVYGSKDPRAGAFGSVMDLNCYPLGHRPDVEGGVLAEKSLALLQDFFTKSRRKAECLETKADNGSPKALPVKEKK